jgi:bacteriorhodopsin
MSIDSVIKTSLAFVGLLALIALVLVAIKNSPHQRQVYYFFEPGIAPICEPAYR